MRTSTATAARIRAGSFPSAAVYLPANGEGEFVTRPGFVKLTPQHRPPEQD